MFRPFRFRLFALPLVLALVLALGFGLALAAHAEIYRLPKDGASPAFALDAPPGWAVAYDQYNNLQLTSPDHVSSLQLSMIDDPQVDTTPPEQLAAQVFKSAGAPPYSRAEAGAIAGRPGQVFSGILPMNGVNLVMRMVVVKLDPRHYACLTTLTRPDIGAAQAGALQRLVDGVTLSGR